eukprot:5471814-Pyramimonas_sp.AAC.1
MPSGTGSLGSGPGIAAPGVCKAAPTPPVWPQTVWGLPPGPVESVQPLSGQSGQDMIQEDVLIITSSPQISLAPHASSESSMRTFL